MNRRTGFTLVEILIVVMILGILAMVVVPRYLSASQDARESAVSSDIQAVRTQIEVYKAQHGGRGPHIGPTGSDDTANMVARLTGKTDASGKLAMGTLGPYLRVWPDNPFASKSVAAAVNFDATATPPRNNASGWYYSTDTCIFSANTSSGGITLDPPATTRTTGSTTDVSTTDVPVGRPAVMPAF